MSSFLLALSDKIKKNQRLFFILIALFLPCILSGLRADHIGTDTSVYLVPTIDAAQSANNFSEYLNTGWYRIWRFLFVSDFEPGFTVLVYITSRTLGVFWTKFILQALIIFPVYASIKKYGKYPAWLGMTVFYLTAYNASLNMMRQSVAVSFTLLGLLYLFEKKYLAFASCFLMAVSFHISGMALILIALIFGFVNSSWYQKNKSARRHRNIKFILISFFGVLSLLSLDFVSQVLSLLGLGGYTNYFAGSFHFVMNQFLVRLPIILIMIANWKQWNKTEVNSSFFATMFVLTLLCLQLVSVNAYSGRIAYYFSIIEVLSYPSLCYSRQSKLQRWLMIIILLIYLISYWWLYFGIQGIDATIPYATYEGGN